MRINMWLSGCGHGPSTRLLSSRRTQLATHSRPADAILSVQHLLTTTRNITFFIQCPTALPAHLSRRPLHGVGGPRPRGGGDVPCPERPFYHRADAFPFPTHSQMTPIQTNQIQSSKTCKDWCVRIPTLLPFLEPARALPPSRNQKHDTNRPILPSLPPPTPFPLTRIPRR